MDNCRFRCTNLARLGELIGLSLWLGGSITISGFLLPLAFQVLPREQAGHYANAVFPIYFNASLVLVAGLFLLQGDRPRRLLLGIAAALLLFNIAVVLPQMQALKSSHMAPEVQQVIFRRWHGASMAVNGLTVLTACVVAALTARRWSRSS